MKAVFLFILMCFSISYVNAVSYGYCSDNHGGVGIRILNPDGGMKLDGSDGVTLLVDSVGRIQIFQRASVHIGGHIVQPHYCATDYGLFVSVRDDKGDYLAGNHPILGLESVSYKPVIGSGTLSDPWVAETVVKLSPTPYYSGGSERITIIDKAYKDITRVDRSISASGLNPNYTYRFTYIFDTFLLNHMDNIGYSNGTVPGTSMPMTIGVKRDQANYIYGAGTMSMSYGGGEPYTSYFVGNIVGTFAHDTAGYGAADLPSQTETINQRNGLALQWKITGKITADMEVIGPEFTGASMESSSSFNPANITVGEESTLTLDLKPTKVNIYEKSFSLTLPRELEYVGPLTVSCGPVSNVVVDNSTGATKLTVTSDDPTTTATERFVIEADKTCSLELKVKGKLLGSASLEEASIVDTDYDLMSIMPSANVGQISIGPKAQGTGVTSSIPSSSLLGLLTIILSLGLLVRFKRK